MEWIDGEALQRFILSCQDKVREEEKRREEYEKEKRREEKERDIKIDVMKSKSGKIDNSFAAFFFSFLFEKQKAARA